MIMNDDLIAQANALRAQAAALDAQVVAVNHEKRLVTVAGLKDVIALHGITAAELGLKVGGKSARQSAGSSVAGGSGAGRTHSSAGKKVAVRYRDGSGNTWTGRGVKPRWLSLAISGGATLASFEISPIL
jgi:DNA-binding protein H-NS